MARPKEDKDLKRSKQIIVRLTETEYELMAETAKLNNQSLSSYVRDLALKGKVNVSYRVELQYDDIKNIAAEVLRSFVNLNQVAKHLNCGGPVTEGLCKDIRRCIAELYKMRNEVGDLWIEFADRRKRQSDKTS